MMDLTPSYNRLERAGLNPDGTFNQRVVQEIGPNGAATVLNQCAGKELPPVELTVPQVKQLLARIAGEGQSGPLWNSLTGITHGLSVRYPDKVWDFFGDFRGYDPIDQGLEVAGRIDKRSNQITAYHK